MKKDFIRKVMYLGSVDTRKYRYVFRAGAIYRLPLEYLDTTRALDGWKLVYGKER